MNESIKKLRDKAITKNLEAIDCLNSLCTDDTHAARYAGFAMLKNLVKAMAEIDSFDRIENRPKKPNAKQ